MKGRNSVFTITITALFLLVLVQVACQQRGNNVSPQPTNAPPTNTPAPVVQVEPATPVAPTTTATATATPEPTITPSPTATPLPPKELVVCMRHAPTSLYLYGDNSPEAVAVRHGLYENLYTSLAYSYQAQGLVKLPSLADGDAVIHQVEVAEGVRVLNAAGAVTRLSIGTAVVNAAGERVVFDGTPVLMPQMAVDFTFRPLVWSDGTAVTAADSVYSYQVAAASGGRAGRTLKLEATADYQATGDLSVRWTGVPGYLDATYFTNVWAPLPHHYLSELTADQLFTANESSRQPLSTGPYVVADWTEDGTITVVKNPYYYRAAEGLPHIDTVIFRPNIQATADTLVVADCDVMMQSTLSLDLGPALLATAEMGEVAAYIVPDMVYEHIDFGINSMSRYGDGEDRPDWFEDARVRRAMTLCTNRQGMVDALMLGHSAVLPAYEPVVHPLIPDDLPQWPYDPAAGNALLDEVGYRDHDGNGIRQLINGTPFSVTLIIEADHPIRQQIGERFQTDMRECGIHVELTYLPAEQVYADGPLGPVFGRRFDLAGFAWLASIQPGCNLWLSANVTGSTQDGFGGWDNLNVTGWSNPAFDEACQAAMQALPGTAEYEPNHQQALRIFAEELPIIPLFSYIKLAAARPEVMNLRLDTTQPSELWNLYELDVPLSQTGE